MTFIGGPSICGYCGMPMFKDNRDLDGINVCPSCLSLRAVKLEPRWKIRPSELELQIRKKVMDDVDKMIEYGAGEEEYHKSTLFRIKDRLDLLWGEQKW